MVIFATNLAANIDPAFERRIRTHILFDMPNAEERERIWRVQLHARKTPAGGRRRFQGAGRALSRSGGDIKNAVLKAAQIATTEPGPDAEKRIHQRHFVQGMEEVVAGQAVMSQSLFDSAGRGGQPGGVLEQMVEGQEQLRGELGLVAERLERLERNLSRVDAGAKAAVQWSGGSVPGDVPPRSARRSAALVLAVRGARIAGAAWLSSRASETRGA